jgi:hypothetical protein
MPGGDPSNPSGPFLSPLKRVDLNRNDAGDYTMKGDLLESSPFFLAKISFTLFSLLRRFQR